MVCISFNTETLFKETNVPKFGVELNRYMVNFVAPFHCATLRHQHIINIIDLPHVIRDVKQYLFSIVIR
jgi:hypothetical protein